MKTVRNILSILAAVTAGITVCQGAKIPRSNEEMMKQAQGVFVGTVQKVTSEEKDGETHGKGKEVITTYTSKILIAEVKKGKDLRVGQEIEVQTMQNRWVGEGTPPPGHSGHHLKPEKNPLFPALRSGHRLFQRPSHRKQIPISNRLSSPSRWHRRFRVIRRSPSPEAMLPCPELAALRRA